MKAKTGLDIFNRILAVVLVIAIVVLALFMFVIKKGGAYEAAPVDANASDADVATIDEFAAGTYGGIQFDSVEDVVNYYVESYNYTKSLTAQYNDNGKTATYYKLLGMENLQVENIMVEGKSNDLINQLVPTIVGSLFTGGLKGLPPCGNIDPTLDTVGDGINVTKSLLTADDVLMANVVDNGDGTINITIQPKAVVLSMPASDAQGHFFNVLGDITSTVESIDQLSFSSGSINDNFVVTYKGGSGTVTINTATGEIVSGDYTMNVHVDVTHANVLVLKDKSASLDIVYTNTFPATAEQLTEKNITAA